MSLIPCFHSVILVIGAHDLAVGPALFTDPLFHPWPQGCEQFCKREHCEWFKVTAGQHFHQALGAFSQRQSNGREGLRRGPV